VSALAPAAEAGEPPRDGNWAARAFMRARRFRRLGAGATVLIGDSIAAQWPENGQIASLGPLANLGIGGDRVQDVQWRLTAYPLTAAPPRAAILIVGSNNAPLEPPETVAGRLIELIGLIRRQAPESRLAVIGILPRGPTLTFKAFEIATINDQVRPAAKDLGFDFVWINEHILKDGGAAGSAMYYRDRAHLNEEGYALLEGRVIEALARAPEPPQSAPP
jgi:lysophospholipase L1-like esterase